MIYCSTQYSPVPAASNFYFLLAPRCLIHAPTLQSTTDLPLPQSQNSIMTLRESGSRGVGLGDNLPAGAMRPERNQKPKSKVKSGCRTCKYVHDPRISRPHI